MDVAEAERAVQTGPVAAGSGVRIELEAAVAFVLAVHNCSLVEVAQVAAGDVALPLAFRETFLVEVALAEAAWFGLLGSPAHKNLDLQ
jgi:hypothetical protein